MWECNVNGVKYTIDENTDKKLEALAKAINDDFEWAMHTQLILENESALNELCKGFLKGVQYATEQYLDILEKEED